MWHVWNCCIVDSDFLLFVLCFSITVSHRQKNRHQEIDGGWGWILGGEEEEVVVVGGFGGCGGEGCGSVWGLIQTWPRQLRNHKTTSQHTTVPHLKTEYQMKQTPILPCLHNSNCLGESIWWIMKTFFFSVCTTLCFSLCFSLCLFFLSPAILYVIFNELCAPSVPSILQLLPFFFILSLFSPSLYPSPLLFSPYLSSLPLPSLSLSLSFQCT